MKCPLSMISNPTECRENDCAAWEDNSKCLIILYLRGYIKQQLITMNMLTLYDDIRKQIKGEE